MSGSLLPVLSVGAESPKARAAALRLLLLGNNLRSLRLLTQLLHLLSHVLRLLLQPQRRCRRQMHI